MKVFKHQHWHFLLLLILLVSIYFIVKNDLSILKGELLDINTRTWLILALLTPIIHQIYVLACWRLELYYNSISNAFGDNGFKLYKIGFALLFFSRLLTIILLAISNSGTLDINSVLIYTIAGILLILSVYLFYSVITYFGIDRAFGKDHFDVDALRKEPFVKKGIFKYTSNGMYIYGFLILWIPGYCYFRKLLF